MVVYWAAYSAPLTPTSTWPRTVVEELLALITTEPFRLHSINRSSKSWMYNCVMIRCLYPLARGFVQLVSRVIGW